MSDYIEGFKVPSKDNWNYKITIILKHANNEEKEENKKKWGYMEVLNSDYFEVKNLQIFEWGDFLTFVQQKEKWYDRQVYLDEISSSGKEFLKKILGLLLENLPLDASVELTFEVQTAIKGEGMYYQGYDIFSGITKIYTILKNISLQMFDFDGPLIHITNTVEHLF